MNASIAIQLLPNVAEDAETCRIVDAVIAYIQSTGLHYHVGPFETTIEGDSLDELFAIAARCAHIAAEAGAPKVSIYLKAVWKPEGDVLSIEQKIHKYQ